MVDGRKFRSGRLLKHDLIFTGLDRSQIERIGQMVDLMWSMLGMIGILSIGAALEYLYEKRR